MQVARIVLGMAVAVARISISHAETDPVECLAKNVYYEAMGESFDGRVAVAAVTLNRADGVAEKVCEVVYFKAVNPITHKKEAAFSWTLGAKWRAKGPINAKAMTECLMIASAVLAGELHSRFDESVKHYHTTNVHPNWKLRVAGQIGKHVFYRG